MQLWATTGKSRCFNRRGDSLGGAAKVTSVWQLDEFSFNRRGDSLGGAAYLGVR